MQKFPQAHCGGVWGSETLIATAREKRALYEKSRCLIVDMESQCAAQIAAEAGLPLAVLRVVCDSADMDVPPVVMHVINEEGGVNVMGGALAPPAPSSKYPICSMSCAARPGAEILLQNAAT